MPQVHILISGRVHGVFFRMHTHKKAQTLGLTGWVRNLSNGNVETFAEGASDALETFINWCHQGPPAAQVENVEVNWFDQENQHSDFRIR